jgi:hypothetical protein
VYVVVKWINLWDLMTILNTNKWKAYIAVALGHGGSLTILVCFTLRHKLLLLFRKKKSSRKDKDEDNLDEGGEEPEGVAKGGINEAEEEKTKRVIIGRQIKERKFQRLLNRWRGRMRKWFWWSSKWMILMKKVM